ncbi:MAG: DNA cytosine methyltransferase, partial [Ruminococcus sp.]|nr:DNA cytosine methyltransferase [Ruminococcus sp.]
MNVLSLYDGISCGMVALERAGILVEKYSAYEIDKYALSVSEKNYPEIEQYGDVFEGNFKKHKGCDLLIGGSPCTYWSIAQKNREITPDGEGFKLFMQYIKALEESCPKYFLYENNNSIHQNIKSKISEFLGVEPIMINSALVSAQQRKRCYWTNIPNITQPKDKGIFLKDVIISDISCQNKSQESLAQYNHIMPAILQRGHGFTKSGTKYDKSPTVTASVSFPFNNLVAQPVRIGTIGNGGQAERIYSVHGKSVTLSANGGGGGAKTGLYKIDLPDGDYIIRKLMPIEAERLQTLPDNYTSGISDTQRYKCIGNGWTVDVIAHIFK